MSVYHEELLERASRELEQKTGWEFEMGSEEKAHTEYMALKRVMKKPGFASNPAKKSLELSRKGSKIVITMATPAPFPEPVKVYFK